MSMLDRQVGSSDLNASVIGLGAINFGNPSRLPDQADSTRVIHAALDAGITFIDTADAYTNGQSETYLGHALAGRRDKVVIATKFKLSDYPDGDARSGLSVRARIMASIDGSLRRLQTDHVDLYQLHHPEPSIPHEEILEPLAELVAAGKVRHIGESNYSAWRHAQSNAVSEARGWPRMVSCQALYNVMRRHVEPELLPFCTANEVGFIPYRPLAGGWLTGKYRPGQPAPGGNRTLSKTFAKMQGNERATTVLESLAAFAEERGRTLTDLAFAWLLAHPAVSSVIAGAMSVEQIATNAAAASWVMSMHERDAVDEIARWDGTGEEVEEPGRHTIPVTIR
jgi:aryl-alcohol dehydrogenase-like predicted oxidoreductase